MREIHYIDIDEEIISAVSRLRNSGQSENVFIFPKRALILQSIVNLRLLEREAKKLGKKIIVVSQDDAGRKLAEKAGLQVEEFHDQALAGPQTKTQARFSVATAEESIPMPEKKSRREARPRATEIGSESFFAHGEGEGGESLHQTASAPLPQTASPARSLKEPAIPPPSSQKLRVRDVSPMPQTSLNSLRQVSASQAPVTAFQKPSPLAISPNAELGTPVNESRPAMPGGTPSRVSPTRPKMRTKLARFMGTPQTYPAPKSLPNAQAAMPKSASPGKRLAWGWLLLVLLVLGGGVGVGMFVLFPKAKITLEPQTAEQVIRFQGALTVEGANGVETFPGRIASLERSVQLSMETTGAATGDNAKARGKIIIYNDFSKDAQPLVATTRFQAPDGKIFRLIDGVTVPGVTETGGKRERGKIEASVVADQDGGEYNLPPTTFTIPGFKGNPKFEKFSAESIQAFTGGGKSGTSNGKKVVSGEDVNRAKTKAIEEAKRLALEEWRQTLGSGEAILEESLLITERPGGSIPPVGAVLDSFTYENRFEIKTFIANETLIRERIAKERVTSDGVTLVPHEYSVRYTALLPKYESGRLDMTVESTVLFQAELQADPLKQALLGKDEAGIRAFLEAHPEIERLQVEFQPDLLVSTIPTRPSRVSVEIINAQPPK